MNLPKSPRTILILLALVLLAVWLIFRLGRAPTVLVTKPNRGPAIEAVYATGTVEPAIMLPIASRASARLVKLNVDEGDEVTKDQILAQLENDDLQSALASARAKETFARSEFERNGELFSKGAVSRQTYERAKSDWEVAKAAVSEASAQTGFLNLSAPADGRIIRRDGELGQLIPMNQPVFWLSVASALRISAEVDEEDISHVKVDQDVAVRADAFPGKIFRAKVKSITPKGDPIARSYRVRIEFVEETPLRIGMTAETNIIINEHKDALLIPSSAVVKGKVFCVVNSRLESRTVSLGIVGQERSEVLSGLTTEDSIVINPSDKLKAGLSVRASPINTE